jgi:hypothetical protein
MPVYTESDTESSNSEMDIEEENRDIDWSFIKKQMIFTILAPLLFLIGKKL